MGTPNTGTDTRIVPTGEQLVRARDLAERAVERYENDHDLDRTDGDWRANVFLGARGEVAVEQFFHKHGFSARIVDDDEDLEIEGGLTVELKMRRLWNYRNPDLLLRYDNPDELSADIYLMVEAQKTPSGIALEVTKWANRQTVAKYLTDFRPDRPQVPREYLDDIETLLPLLNLFREEGPVEMADDSR